MGPNNDKGIPNLFKPHKSQTLYGSCLQTYFQHTVLIQTGINKEVV